MRLAWGIAVVLFGCQASAEAPQDAGDGIPEDAGGAEAGDPCSACDPKTETCAATLTPGVSTPGHGSSGTYSAGCKPLPAACLNNVTCACIQQAEDMPSSGGYSCNIVSDGGLIFTKYNE